MLCQPVPDCPDERAVMGKLAQSIADIGIVGEVETSVDELQSVGSHAVWTSFSIDERYEIVSCGRTF